MYRPQSFDDVVGQEHVTKTLRNAISKGSNLMLTYLVAQEELGRRVLLKYLRKLSIVQIVRMENHVMSVRFVKALRKVLTLMLLKLMPQVTMV